MLSLLYTLRQKRSHFPLNHVGLDVMALHCTVLRARELFVLRMRTLAIQYPDPWGKSAIPNKENSPPCRGCGGGGWSVISLMVLLHHCMTI